jgi:thiol:disulfide interchange protein DsbA
MSSRLRLIDHSLIFEDLPMHARAVLKSTLMIATLLVATACTAKSPEAASTPALPTPAASVAVASAATTTAPSAASSAATAAASTAAAAAVATVAPPKGMPAGPTPVEGTDYFLIDTPDQPSGDKVQVVEVFGYGCHHCADLQPFLSAWKKTLPSDVQFSYLPGPFGGLPDGFQRAFFAAQAMGVQEKSHDNIFKAVHVDKRVVTADDIPKLYADYGVDPKVFASTMQSFAVSAKLASAQDQETRWGVDGTPTFVIDGKYRALQTAAGPSNLLHTLDWLIAKQRPEHAKH